MCPQSCFHLICSIVPPGMLNSSHYKWLLIFWAEDDFELLYLCICHFGNLSHSCLISHTLRQSVALVPVLCRWCWSQPDRWTSLSTWLLFSISSSCLFFFFNKCLSHELIKKLFFIFSPAQSTFNLTSSWCNSLHHQALLRTDSEISPGWMTSSRFLTDLHPCVFFHSSL